ncbi:MAG: hypothetical protein ACFBSF_07230 [Leptolyngbyaceae cyanobacterium]
MKWKPWKWWLIGLIALLWALWANSSSLPVQASSTYQDTFKIGGDLVVAESQTVGDAFVIGGDITVQEGVSIQGDVFAIGGTVQLEKNARVEGDAFAIGGQVIRAESAIVNGSEFTLLEQSAGLFERFGVLGTLYISNVAFWLVSSVVIAIAGFLLLLLLPGHVDAIATAVQVRPLTSVVYGIGGVAVLILLTVLTAGSVLGTVLVPLMNLIAMLTGLLGSTAVCVWLGKRLRGRQSEARFQHFWLGLILIFLVSLIPVLGGLLVSFITLFGFGATLLVRYGTQSASKTPVTLDRLEHQTE